MDLAAQLKEISAGRGSLAELSQVLAAQSEMFFLPPSERLMQYLRSAALELGEQPFEPPLHGSLHEGNFIPAVFTTIEAADALARLNGFVGEDEVSLVQSRPWKQSVHQFLLWGYGGLIIDGGTEHKICLNREQLSILGAKFTLEDLAEADTVFAAMDKGGLHVHEPLPGQNLVFIFDSEEAGRHGSDFLLGSVVGAEQVQVVELKVKDLLDMLVQQRPDQLLLNAGLPDSRPYFRADLENLVQIVSSRNALS